MDVRVASCGWDVAMLSALFVLFGLAGAWCKLYAPMILYGRYNFVCGLWFQWE